MIRRPQRIFHGASLHGPARIRGVSLIELMVALVLGLIVTGSALTLFLTNQQTFTATENLGRVQESARVAFELMARELREAAGNPCDGRLVLANGLVDLTGNWWSDWGDPDGLGGIAEQPGLFGYAAAAPFADAGFGSGEGQRVSGTDAIELKAAVPVSANLAVLTTGMGAVSSGDIQVSSVDGLSVGDLLVLCNYVNASLFQATGFSGNAIEHASGSADWENRSGTLEKIVTTAEGNYDEGSIISRLHASRWYIGNNGRGGRSLYRATLRNEGGSLDDGIDEVAEGVTGMTLEYLTQSGTDYVPAGSVAAWNDAGNRVVAVRVALTLAGQDRIGTDGAVLQRTLQHTVAIRNRSR